MLIKKIKKRTKLRTQLSGRFLCLEFSLSLKLHKNIKKYESMAENIIDKARYGNPELKVSTPNNIIDSVAIIIATFLLDVKVTTKKYQ
ncbi:hypothetical protein [Escherichia sp. E3356]|uniref:hypothetical protein n=1 Tax=Escherichia sp. E3356 TaxID=2044461 RepID=UPI0014368059|nr:hypothetical protein [Escherichia sp. E3356]